MKRIKALNGGSHGSKLSLHNINSGQNKSIETKVTESSAYRQRPILVALAIVYSLIAGYLLYSFSVWNQNFQSQIVMILSGLAMGSVVSLLLTKKELKQLLLKGEIQRSIIKVLIYCYPIFLFFPTISLSFNNAVLYYGFFFACTSVAVIVNAILTVTWENANNIVTYAKGTHLFSIHK